MKENDEPELADLSSVEITAIALTLSRLRAERVLDERGRIIAEEARSHELVYYKGEAMERWQYEELFGRALHDATLREEG